MMMTKIYGKRLMMKSIEWNMTLGVWESIWSTLQPWEHDDSHHSHVILEIQSLRGTSQSQQVYLDTVTARGNKQQCFWSQILSPLTDDSATMTRLPVRVLAYKSQGHNFLVELPSQPELTLAPWRTWVWESMRVMAMMAFISLYQGDDWVTWFSSATF